MEDLRNKYKLSIIVPVYNNSKYIDVCMKSLIRQTLDDIEIIVIDDCSNDNSYEKLGKYNVYPFIRILRNDKNYGAGYTRNKGIELANGEYIGFVDADDYVSVRMFELSYKAAVESNADILMSDIVFVKDDTFYRMGNQYLEYDDKVPRRITDKKSDIKYISNSPCNKIYKKEFIKGIKFPEDCKWEDIGFTTMAFLMADRILYINNPGYFYRRDLSSGISGVNYKENDRVSDIVKVNDYMVREMTREGLYQEYFDEYSYITAYSFLQRVEEINNWSNRSKKRYYIEYLYGELYNRAGNLANIDIDLLSSKVSLDIVYDYLDYINMKKGITKK